MSRIASRTGGMVVLLLLVSCNKPVSATLDQRFDLQVGRAARLESGELDLYFRGVVSDSRCPRDVQCVTAGEAAVALEARSPRAAQASFEVRLSDDEDPSEAATYNDYRIRLVRLEPYPVTSVERDSTAYVGTFIVDKL